MPKPPAAAACTPDTASSTTAERAGFTPSIFAQVRNVSGAGLPGSPCSAAKWPSTMMSKESCSPAAASTGTLLRLAVTRPTGTPAARSRSMSATVFSNTRTPWTCRASWK